MNNFSALKFRMETNKDWRRYRRRSFKSWLERTFPWVFGRRLTIKIDGDEYVVVNPTVVKVGEAVVNGDVVTLSADVKYDKFIKNINFGPPMTVAQNKK
jgi:hypothetical protein